MSKRNKKDVDRYVSQIPEKEKSSRGYQIAVLYNDAGDYETAKRYLSAYISTRETVPQAHKLMGQIYESANNKEQAIASYKRSLELDSKQKDLILKVCELYNTSKDVDIERLKYWVEQAERFHPNSPVVFKLKERVMSGANLEDMEDFYAKQLVKNYNDVYLHTKLLDLYCNEDKIGNAYRHTVDVEKTQAFADNVVWYENVTRIFTAYQKKEHCGSDTSFHTHRLIVLCNLVYLQIKEKEIVSCAQSLYMLDQSLKEAIMIKSQKPEWTAILSEVQGMYYFLCGLLLFKRATKGQLSWKDASSFSLVCFLLSSSFPVINKTSSFFTQSKSVQLHKFYERVHLFGCYRLSQTGYVVASLLKGEASSQLNAQRQQLRTPQARDKLYDIMFTMREMREKKDQSYLMNSDSYCHAQIITPSKKLVSENDASVQELFADNLHQLVWLALQKYSKKDQFHTDYGMTVYKFPFSTDNFDVSSLESLCQLDIQAFFMATVRCALLHYEEQQDLGRKDQFKPYLVPACLCQSLCTSQQDEWWTAMFKFSTGKANDNFPKLRATLQRGIEVIRLQGTHGLSVVAVANIARTFDQMFKDLERNQSAQPQDRLSSYSERAAFYWKEANNMLERVERKSSQRMPKERLFDDGDHGVIDPNQIQDVKDQAIFSLAKMAMTSGQYEEAKAKFESIKTPWASYYLAKIFRDMSEQINSDDLELAGEKLVLMERALDTLYLTLDRLKVHKNQDLEKMVPTEIDDVVNELERLRMPGIALVDSICSGVNGMSHQPIPEGDEGNDSEEEYVSFNTPQGRAEQPVQPVPSIASPSFVASTPARPPSKSPGSKLHFSMEVNQRPRPSPERLEARIWALEKKQETVIDLVQDMKIQNSELKQAVKDLKDGYEDVLRQVKELVLYQRPVPPQPMYPSPYAGSMYRPSYTYQPTPPMMPQSAYSYPMTMSPGPAGRPISSHVSRVSQFQPQNAEDDFYDGDFYEDDGSGQGMYGTDTSGWTVNHKPALEGTSSHAYPTQSQQMPQAGFFAQALRGQALQFQQGQSLSGQSSKQNSPMTGHGGLPTTQTFSSGSVSGTQSQTASTAIGMFPATGIQPSQPQQAGAATGRFPLQTQTSSQLAELLSDNLPSCSRNVVETKAPVMTKSSEVQRPQFGTASASGNTSIQSPNTMPLLSSLMAASTSPDKPLTNPPVSMVTAVAPGSSAPKGTFAFGQTGLSTGNQSPFNFGQISSKPISTGTNLFSSPQKVSTTMPSAVGNMFSSSQKENVFAGTSTSKAVSPVKSPSKTGEDHVEEYEPNVDFKPVIDLPALVETKTGEEEEESMFCERAKLFRFDDGQWKERGTGPLKILRHKETQRVRILMRRDQVLKICANHFLTKDMKLSPMQSSNKAWCWSAQDFSEGELQVEKFAARFKDEDVTSRFKATFEKLQSELDKTTVKPKSEVFTPASSGQPSLGSLFKKEEGSWSCNACLVSNKVDVQKCVACGTLKPGLKPEDVKPTENKGSSLGIGSSTGGFKLGSSVLDQKPAGSGFTFQSGTTPAVSGFKFGQTTLTDKGKPETAKPDSTTPATATGFKFGGQTSTFVNKPSVESDTNKPPLSAGFKFGQLPPSEKGKTEQKPDEKTDASKATPFGSFTLGQTGKPGFSVPGVSTTGTGQTAKETPTSSFTFKPSAFGTTESQTSKDSKDKPTFTFKPTAPVATTVPQKAADLAKPEAVKKDEKKGFGDLFKPKEGSWKCDGCLVSNNGDALKCAACGALKPGVTKEDAKAAGISASGAGKKEEKKGFGDLFKPKEGSWKCDGCLMSNNGDVLKCPACETLKPGVKKEDIKDNAKPVFGTGTSGGFSFGPKGGFSFGSSGKSETTSAPTGFSFSPSTSNASKEKQDSKPASGFNFKPTTADTQSKDSKPASGFNFKPATANTPTQNKDSKPSSGFSFTPTSTDKSNSDAKGFSFSLDPTKTSASQKSGFSFTMSPTKDGGPKSPPTDAEGMYVNKEGEDDHIYFEPVIALPSVIDVVTGEEEDEVLFQHRAKLFRFVNGEWKERGLGDIKISKNKASGKVRLLMRREQILKICLNHYLSKDLVLKPMPNTNGKAWIWYAMDCSDGEPSMQQLAVKFKNEELASDFKRVFDNARDNLKEMASVEKSPSKGSAEGGVPKSSNDDDVVFIKTETATEEQIRMARKYQLPDNFYLYESKPPCPGCIGCEDYTPGKICSPPKQKGKVKANEDKNTSNAKPAFGETSGSSLFGQKSEGSLFSVSTKPGSIFGSTDSSASTTEVKGGVFGGGASGFSFSSLAKDTSTTGMFGSSAGGFNFSDLAKQANTSTSPGFKVKDDSKQFSWTGTGQKLFSGAGGDHAGDDGDEEGDDGGATYDPHYEPIIDLPDLVDVKTGEEEYDKLFCQRAKLFRFDKEANQWKEKGLGEMKILQHKENRRYRLLLRREQVLKIACNQWLTPEISFKPLPTSETSWCWVGQDFSDNEPAIEQLAVKFKTIDLANQFKETIDKCQVELRQRKSSAPENLSEKGDADKIPMTVTSQQSTEEMREEDEDDENYSTEEEEELLFEKRIKFFTKEETWKVIGLGNLRVLYDEDVNGQRIMVELDNKTIVCNHLVAKESAVIVNKKDCDWSPIDFSTDEPVRRTFRAQFSSDQAAVEFENVVREGRQLAIESDISERNMVTFPREITFPAGHAGSSQ